MANYGDRNSRPFEPPTADPIAFLLTWTTYGTWLPGDERGWSDYRRGFQLPDPIVELESRARMTEDACHLDDEHRRVVEQTIADHCQIRGWQLHAVNCRTNHVHVVMSCGRDPEEARDQLKAWGTRKLKELEQQRRTDSTSRFEPPIRQKWWTERGSQRWIDNEDNLIAAVRYVVEGQ